MANRRQGYGGGRHNFNSGPVNPWQGGNVPGGGQFNANNLMSQLSEPQAQLALALTKLLQPQQQVPSLLSMNTLPPMHGGGYGPNRNFRGGPGPNMNRRPQNNLNKPFNNNKMQNRNNDGFRRRARANSKNKSTVVSTKPQRTSPAASKSNKPSSPTKASSKPSGTEASKTSDLGVKVEPNDDTQTPDKETDDKSEKIDVKREWKEEKSGTQDDENEEEVKEDSEEGADAENEDSNDNEKTDESGEKKTCRYEGIPKELLHCFICQKVMWDPESFEKHMNGRAHQQMFEKVEESYRIKADMMREAIRLSEEKNNIEMDRMKRLGKKTKQQMLSRCAMCDLDFYGQLFLHRKSPGHQKLKHFLHPKCQYCNKEFPNRMEWENHRHTPEHLRKKVAADKKDGHKTDDDNDEGVMLEDECFVVIDSTEAEDLEDSNVVTDINDEDLKDVSIKIPTYKQNRAVGLSLIKPVSGYFCKPCSKFFLTEKASQQHATGKTHYSAFVKILNEKMAENEKKRKMSVGEDEEDDEGNWKRRKASKEGEEEEEEKGDGDELYDPLEASDVPDESLKMDTANNTVDNDTSVDESFLTTADPNESTLNESANKSIINDVTWNEVDSKIDEILEDNQEEKEKPSPAVSPVKGRNPRPQRATRGRKAN